MKLTPEERKLGEFLHNYDGRRSDAIEESGHSVSHCYKILRMYREANGLPVQQGRGGPTVVPPLPESVKVLAKTSNLGLMRVDASGRVRELEIQLDRAHKEVETLQKIVMVLGEKL